MRKMVKGKVVTLEKLENPDLKVSLFYINTKNNEFRVVRPAVSVNSTFNNNEPIVNVRQMNLF